MTKLSPKIWYLLKYGFLAIVAAGIFVSVLPESKPEDIPNTLDTLDLIGENFSEPYIDERLTLEILRDDVTDCITKGIRGDAERETFKYDGQFIDRKENIKVDPTIFTVLTSFHNLLSHLGIKAVIIEPSVLYCMLLPTYQELLLKRHFDISRFSKPNNIMTLGVMKDDVVTLQEEGSIYRFSRIDFQPYFGQHSLASWMRRDTIQSEFETFPSHIFYKHKLFTIHIVVFHERSSFYWHEALGIENKKIPPKKKLKFVDYSGAYEKFAFVSLENKVLPIADFYIPSNPHFFLFEMMTSHFLECNFLSAPSVFSAYLPKSHPEMSVERFNRRTRVVLRELKTIFHPKLMNFWLWSGTMLGWYRQCDIIPYTTDVDFGAWATEVEDLDVIINMLLNNKHVTIKQRMGLLQEALELQLHCHNLQTDVFFLYHIENGTWYSGHSPKLGYYFRYFLPNFTICSAELLGEKVQVPCETEKVIAGDYGPGWRKPAATWNYETSSQNRGPNIYWERHRLKNAYQVY